MEENTIRVEQTSCSGDPLLWSLLFDICLLTLLTCHRIWRYRCDFRRTSSRYDGMLKRKCAFLSSRWIRQLTAFNVAIASFTLQPRSTSRHIFGSRIRHASFIPSTYCQRRHPFVAFRIMQIADLQMVQVAATWLLTSAQRNRAYRVNDRREA